MTNFKYKQTLESSQQALEEMKLKLQEKFQDDYDYDMEECKRFVQQKVCNPSLIKEFEDKCNCKIPADLYDFYLTEGGFQYGVDYGWGNGNIEVYGDWNKYKDIFGGFWDKMDLGLRDIFNSVNSSQPDIFPENAIEFLNTHFFTFGHYQVGDCDYTYFFFTKDGKYGACTMYHDSDWYDLDEMFAGTIFLYHSLDDLLVAAIGWRKEYYEKWFNETMNE